MEYKVINRCNSSDLNEEVNDMLRKGWRLKDKLIVTPSKSSCYDTIYTQVLVKGPVTEYSVPPTPTAPYLNH